MGEITKVKTANHEEWLKLRSQYIGGSDAAAVVGLNAYASPYSLWAEKTGKIPGFACLFCPKAIRGSVGVQPNHRRRITAADVLTS